MKKALLFLGLCLNLFMLNAQTPNLPTDRQLIETTIQLYFDGWATGDTNKLGKAMHATCHLKVFRDGTFLDIPRLDYLNRFKPHERDKNLTTHIVYVDITDNKVAGAKVEINAATLKFTDYFNLMKTSEGWFIVDKISTNSPHKTIVTNVPKPEKEVIIEGLKRPWSIAFLSEENVLITEKEGDLLKMNLVTKVKTPIKGFPTDIVDSIGAYHFGDNSGIFEVVLDPNFTQNKWVYISYATESKEGKTTKVIRGKLENDALQDVQTLLIATPYSADRYHYGGGMVFGQDGKLYITIGERLFTEKDEPEIPIAQDVRDRRGKIYRINPDGSIPDDNPNFGSNAVKGLYALGIRAAQGLTVEPVTKKIWFSEHGTIQGDEINVLKAGANYGWPIKTTGKYRFEGYNPVKTKDSVYTDPVWSWFHTVAPTGLTFYTGDEFPLWKNNLLVAGLSKGSLWRMTIEGESIKSAEELFIDSRVRVRKITQSPMGKLYILTDDKNGQLIRIKNGAK
jgi:aldose sugar dehydrogenase